MKLQSVYIEKYKNLTGTYDFTSQDSYIALIGENGSGKSNLLEAISIIFSCLYNEQDPPFNYKIVYDLNGESQIIESKEGKIISEKAKYPSSVISCYSGEDLRLWHLAYEFYHMQYFNKAINNKTYTQFLLYINKYCWKIAFISLLCASEQGDKNIESFFKSKLGIDETTDVDIAFKIEHEKLEKFKEHDALKWFNRFRETDYKVNARVLSTTEPNPSTEAIRKQKNCKTIFQYLYLLSQPKQNEINKVDKLITDIEITIKGIEFNNLSEGEKKLILIECITRILGDKESLILLDEPDAHIHIARKKELLDAIESFEGQTILTTHSPVFTSIMAKEAIFPLKNGAFIDTEQRDLIAKLANNNINYIDGACVVSSKYLVLTEGPGDINYITSAIEACGKDDVRYKILEKASFVYIGGANQVEDFDNEILSKLYHTLEAIVFIFDYDSEGREGDKQVQKLINAGKDKIKTLYYNKTYPINPDQDFYLEDMFERRIYNVIQLPTIHGEPTYAQLKKGDSLAKSIKSKIAKLYNNKFLNDDDYHSFKPFLDQLIKLLNL